MTTQFDFVCFGGVDWWYHNHGHFDIQMMRRFSEYGRVLFINSIVMQKPSASMGGQLMAKATRKALSIFTGLKQVDETFWVYSPIGFPVSHVNWLKAFNDRLVAYQVLRVLKELEFNLCVTWVTIPTANRIALAIPNIKLVYQRTDRSEETPGVDYETIATNDRLLKKRADLTIYVNTELYERERLQCKSALYLDHGVDYNLFSSDDGDDIGPSDISSIPEPIAGYIGTVEKIKIDIAFLKELLIRCEDVSFVFIGSVEPQFLALSKQKNVWFLGQKPYRDVPKYGRCFSVSIIPWRKSKWTEAANPVKLKEYLALGKPIVSTPSFSELEKYNDLVYVAESPLTFAQSIKTATRERSTETIAIRRKSVITSSWDDKADTILRLLKE